MRRLLTVGIVGLAVAGCAEASIAITHLETDEVIIKAGYLTPSQRVFDAAAKGCAAHGKVAQPISVECLGESCTVKNYHFACILRWACLFPSVARRTGTTGSPDNQALSSRITVLTLSSRA